MEILRRMVFAKHDRAALPTDKKPTDPIRSGNTYKASELKAAYGSCVAGTNLYVGVNSKNLDLAGFEQNSMPSIQSWIDITPPEGSFSLMIGLEPSDDKTLNGEQKLQYVIDHIDIVKKLGERLKGIIDDCAGANKTVTITIRYASEMNPGGGNPYSGHPDLFKKSYKEVYKTLKAACPEVLMVFSPAINQESSIDFSDYWPGDDLVDLVGCTWYWVGKEPERKKAKKNLDDYFKKYASPERLPCVDELGGTTKRGSYTVPNEEDYQNMVQHLINLNLPGVKLHHLTCFLEGSWGSEVTLDFLCP